MRNKKYHQIKKINRINFGDEIFNNEKTIKYFFKKKGEKYCEEKARALEIYYDFVSDNKKYKWSKDDCEIFCPKCDEKENINIINKINI